MGCEVKNIPVADHGELDGLTDDDHSQYLLLAGRSSTQSISKGTTQVPVTLTDGSTVALDASQGNIFYLNSTQNPTILTPTNATNGQKIVIIFKATSSDRTLSLTTGSSGAFIFGTDITALSATTSGKEDYIGCIYHTGTLNRWAVVSYVKGF